MAGLLAALVVVAGGIAALFRIGLGIWFQISCPGRLLTASADLRTSPAKHLGLSPAKHLGLSPAKHLGLSPASTTALSPARWPGSGQLALPGQAR